MASTQTASINISVQVNATNTAGRTSVASLPNGNRSLADGTSADQADKCYEAVRTLAYSSTPDGLDFAGGGLIDLAGDAITWVEMTTLIIEADSENEEDIVVGGHANPLNFGAGANTISIQPGEQKILINTSNDPAYPVTAGSADTLKVAIAAGVNQSYKIIAVGRSA